MFRGLTFRGLRHIGRRLEDPESSFEGLWLYCLEILDGEIVIAEH